MSQLLRSVSIGLDFLPCERASRWDLWIQRGCGGGARGSSGVGVAIRKGWVACLPNLYTLEADGVSEASRRTFC